MAKKSAKRQVVRAPAKTCFVMMPFAGEFQDLYHVGIVPVLSELGYRVVRADDIALSGNILTNIVRLIASADMILVDVSKANANVFYELGIAHALGRPTVIISSKLEYVPLRSS